MWCCTNSHHIKPKGQTLSTAEDIKHELNSHNNFHKPKETNS